VIVQVADIQKGKVDPVDHDSSIRFPCCYGLAMKSQLPTRSMVVK
jgi:hypothetical protein